MIILWAHAIVIIDAQAFGLTQSHQDSIREY